VDVPEPAEALADVEAVADVELVRNGEADVPDRQVVDEAAVGPVEERANGDVSRLSEEEGLHHVVEGQPGVDDVLHEHDVPVADREIEILEQPDARAAAEASVVACEDEKVQGVRDRQGAREVGSEDERALEDRYEQRLAALVDPGELRSQLGDAGRDLPLGEVDVAGAWAAGRYETGFRPYLCARRSKSRFVKSLILMSGWRSRSLRILRFLRVMSDCFITVTSR
jgi:hypothetical protein